MLVVDDNADAALLLAEALRLMGYPALVAHDGPGALALAAREKPEVVLLDIGLPVMDGHEVARRLRDELPDAKPLLVAVTGYGQPADLARSRESGFAHHLVKPIDLERLRSILAALPNRGGGV